MAEKNKKKVKEEEKMEKTIQLTFTGETVHRANVQNSSNGSLSAGVLGSRLSS